MALHLADTLPCSLLSQVLPDDLLESVHCDTNASTYSYQCGCTAVRPVEDGECYVRWCATHRSKYFQR